MKMLENVGVINDEEEMKGLFFVWDEVSIENHFN